VICSVIVILPTNENTNAPALAGTLIEYVPSELVVAPVRAFHSTTILTPERAPPPAEDVTLPVIDL